MKHRIKTALVQHPATFIANMNGRVGWGNGYVGVPPGHPWFEKPYDSINASVHGGLTYAAHNIPLQPPDELWWVGWDSCHLDDSQDLWPKSAVEAETNRLLEQAVAACDQHASLLDITAPNEVEVQVRSDGTVLWVNIDGVCRLRACRCKEIVVTDDRSPKP